MFFRDLSVLCFALTATGASAAPGDGHGLRKMSLSHHTKERTLSIPGLGDPSLKCDAGFNCLDKDPCHGNHGHTAFQHEDPKMWILCAGKQCYMNTCPDNQFWDETEQQCASSCAPGSVHPIDPDTCDFVQEYTLQALPNTIGIRFAPPDDPTDAVDVFIESIGWDYDFKCGYDQFSVLPFTPLPKLPVTENNEEGISFLRFKFTDYTEKPMKTKIIYTDKSTGKKSCNIIKILSPSDLQHPPVWFSSGSTAGPYTLE